MTRSRRLARDVAALTILAVALATSGRGVVAGNLANLRGLRALDITAGPAAESTWIPCFAAPATEAGLAGAGVPITVALRQDCLTPVSRSAGPTDPVSGLWLGIAAERRGRHADALSHWRGAGAWHYFMNAAILRAPPGREIAIRFAGYVMELQPDNWSAALAVGRQLREVAPDEAVDALERAAVLAPAGAATQADIARELGIVHLRRQRYDLAAAAYATATTFDPSNREAWQGLGEAAFYAGDPARAVEAFERLRAIAGETPALRFWIGRARAAQAAGRGI